MGSLDQISSAIGGLQEGQRHVLDKLDHIHDCLHATGGLVGRVSSLEHTNTFGKGKAAGIGAVGGAVAGAGVTALWKAFAAKLGML